MEFGLVLVIDSGVLCGLVIILGSIYAYIMCMKIKPNQKFFLGANADPLRISSPAIRTEAGLLGRSRHVYEYKYETLLPPGPCITIVNLESRLANGSAAFI